MRNLFLALVLANLAFAAWSAWFAPTQPTGRRADDGLPALTLVSEVPTDLRSSGAVVEDAAPEEASANRANAVAVTDTPAPPCRPAVAAPPASGELAAARAQAAAARPRPSAMARGSRSPRRSIVLLRRWRARSASRRSCT